MSAPNTTRGIGEVEMAGGSIVFRAENSRGTYPFELRLDPGEAQHHDAALAHAKALLDEIDPPPTLRLMAGENGPSAARRRHRAPRLVAPGPTDDAS